jgi:EmrB/QacA subfamily drug resistance transporter
MNKKQLLLLPAILATGILSFSGVLIETAMNVTFPTLCKQFGTSTANIQWITTIYLLTISIVVPLSTYLFKNVSLKTLFIFSNLMFILGLMIDFFSSSLGVLLIGRCFQGVATGIALPLMFHIILTYAPLEKRGAMIGIGTLTTSIAPAIGPTYGGILTVHFTWNLIFLLLIPFILISLGIGVYAIPRQKVEKNTSLDFISLVGVAFLFSGLLLFLSSLGDKFAWLYLGMGVLGLAVILFRVKKTETPLVNLTVLKNKKFDLFLYSFLICQALLLGISFVLPNFVQIVNGESAFTAGLIMIPGAIIGALLQPLSGRLFDRFGPKRPIVAGLGIATVGWTLLLLSLGRFGIPMLVFCHVIYMIGSGLCYSNLMTMGMNQLTPTLESDGNALFNTLQQFSGAVATAVVAMIINTVQQQSASFSKGTIIGSQLSMLVILILLLFSLVGCLRYFRKR